MPKVSNDEREHAKRYLLDTLDGVDTVYCVLVRSSSSGMSRVIKLLVPKKGIRTHYLHDGTPVMVEWLYIHNISWNAHLVLGWRMSRDREGILVSGAGMDMGFHTVYSLSHALYGDGYKLSKSWL